MNEEPPPLPSVDDILVVRRGPGANCSSVGSVIDILFLSAVAGGAILVACAAALGDGARASDVRKAENDPNDESPDKDADASSR